MGLDEISTSGGVMTPPIEAAGASQGCQGPVRVAVVSRTELVRAGLARLLGGHPERVEVVDVGPGDRLTEPDVVVYDLSTLVDRGSDDLTRFLAGQRAVVGLEPPARPDVAELALALGVAEVVPLEVTADDLLSALERGAAGQRVSADDLHRSRRRELMRLHGLSERELDILELVGSGVSNNEIAAELYLSINSIKSYIRTAYRKIDVSSRSQAVLWAVQHSVPTAGHQADGQLVD